MPEQPPAIAPAASRQRLKIFYSGRVQGVGFRYTAKTVAAGFEIAGTVRNLPDGRVELVAEGAREELEAFRAAIRNAGLASLHPRRKYKLEPARKMNFADLKSSAEHMKYAIIADIHANLEALQVVLDDIKAQNADHIVCLGDVVGYNANPKECLKIVRDMNIPVRQGQPRRILLQRRRARRLQPRTPPTPSIGRATS